MLKLAQKVILSEGWHRRIIAFSAGAFGALALPPIGIIPAFLVPMVISVWLIDGSAGRAFPVAGHGPARMLLSRLHIAAGAGWWLGFGYFVAGLWWLGAAFLVEAEQFAWAMPLGVLGLPALLACFTAFGFGVARLLWSPGSPRILALAVGLGLSEWLRGHLLTGFPWNDFGMVLGSNLYLAQFAAVTGLYGLTVLAIAIFAAPALLADGNSNRALPVYVPLLALVALASFGIMRLSGADAGVVKGVRLRIMQPNVAHDLKFRTTGDEKLISDYLALSDQSTSPQNTGLSDVTHLIWPESPFPFILSRDPAAMAAIQQKLTQGLILLTGAARLGASGTGDTQPQVYNTIHVITRDGTILESYDKVHLVPFGEYIPFTAALKAVGLRQFVLSSFTPGKIRHLLTVPGLPPVAPLICYEAIFSGDVMPAAIDAASIRPGLFLNVTDDSWFGSTPGPYQHLFQARLRVIEEGIPMVRAADTGISAIIDPYGRIMRSLPLGTEGVLDGSLPQVAAAPLFTRWRLLASVTIWFIALISNSLARLRI